MSNRLERAVKALSKQDLEDLEQMSTQDLQKRIVQANEAMEQAQAELEANPKYVALKEDLKALGQGKRDLDKRQKAIILVSLHNLEQKGQ